MSVDRETYRQFLSTAAAFAGARGGERIRRGRELLSAARDLGAGPLSPVTDLPGVGRERARILQRLGITVIEDLARYLPRRYEDRQWTGQIGDGAAALPATVTKVTRYRRRVTAMLSTPVGAVRAVWFHRPYLAGQIRTGDWVGLYGKVQPGSPADLIEPEIAAGPARRPVPSLHWGRLVPLYPGTGGLTARQLREWTAVACWLVIAGVEDPVPDAGEPGLSTALIGVHFPADLDAARQGRNRLLFDRALGRQLWFELRRSARNRQPGVAHRPDRWYEIGTVFPYELTSDQQRAIDEVAADLEAPQPMNRMLVGDVGTGKTAVAIAAAGRAVYSGSQVAVLTPTDLVANQHYRTFNWLSGLGIRVELFTAAAPDRQAVLGRLAAGETDVVVGTHALLGCSVEFSRLGLVIIDEQHRFGVRQRGRLLRRTPRPDLLALTATPIPRTVALAGMGHVDVSRLKSRPPGRRVPETRVVPALSTDGLDAMIRQELARDGRVFVVCPRLEDDGDNGVSPATAVFNRLSQSADSAYRVELLHGRLDAARQQSAIARFAAGSIEVLVATSVIEVGVDVPAATMMVVLDADRFGLAQLHQLRGRVGRSERPGWCVLVPSRPESGRERLELLVKHTSGLAIAIADLRLRGPGELHGLAQHGFSADDLEIPGQTWRRARSTARNLLRSDPGLRSSEGLVRLIRRFAPPVHQPE